MGSVQSYFPAANAPPGMVKKSPTQAVSNAGVQRAAPGPAARAKARSAEMELELNPPFQALKEETML
jgi:hypothetical protein